MKCKKIQTLLITDFIDNNLNLKEHNKVLTHLAQCERCRLFEKAVKENAVNPFKQNTAPNLTAPEHIWQDIKNIINHKPKQNLLNIITTNILNVITNIRKPKLTLSLIATFTVCFICFNLYLTINEKNILRNYFNDQTDFLTSLQQNTLTEQNLNNFEFKTTIENFFI